MEVTRNLRLCGHRSVTITGRIHTHWDRCDIPHEIDSESFLAILSIVVRRHCIFSYPVLCVNLKVSYRVTRISMQRLVATLTHASAITRLTWMCATWISQTMTLYFYFGLEMIHRSVKTMYQVASENDRYKYIERPLITLSLAIPFIHGGCHTCSSESRGNLLSKWLMN